MWWQFLAGRAGTPCLAGGVNFRGACRDFAANLPLGGGLTQQLRSVNILPNSAELWDASGFAPHMGDPPCEMLAELSWPDSSYVFAGPSLSLSARNTSPKELK